MMGMSYGPWVSKGSGTVSEAKWDGKITKAEFVE